MLSYFSIPRKIGTTFSDIQYIDTRVPEDIVNEYRSAAKTSSQSSQNNSFLSKSTELEPPRSSFNPPARVIHQSRSLAHSGPLSSINLNNYYSDYYLRNNIPYLSVPHFPDNAYFNHQLPYHGMKLSRSDYILSKPPRYHFHQMVYPVNYALNPNQF